MDNCEKHGILNRGRTLKSAAVGALAFALCALGAEAKNIYITPDADGTGDGSSWASPMSLAYYLATAKPAHGDVVRLKSGKYTAQIQQVTFGMYMNVRISGGYAGTNDTTLDEDFPYSDIDFANYPTSGNLSPLQFVAIDNYSVELERLQLRRARNAAIYKKNAGTLTLSDCVVVSNGWKNYSGSSSAGGRGVHVAGGTFTATGCRFAYNGMYSGSSSFTSPSDHGYGVYLSGTTARLTGCKFIGNGARISDEAPVSSVRGGGRGLALYATGSKVYAEDCDFLCNRGALGSYAGSAANEAEGGIVVLAGNCNGSWFTNCSWVANQNLRDTTYNGNTYYGGVLTIDMSSRSHAVSADKCTFAYNITDSSNAAAGIDVRNGTLNLRNSVFTGNQARTGNPLGVDLVVRTNGTANVEYCLFEATDGGHITIEKIGENEGQLSMSGTVLGDALLATEKTAAAALVKIRTAKPYLAYNPTRIDEVLAFDLHPRSKGGRWTAAGYVRDRKHSPAIDAGDPLASFGVEPRPNGARLNLGRYGGTEEASLTFIPPGTFLSVQ